MFRRLALLFALLFSFAPGLEAAADSSLFPRPSGIEARVRFWTRIYTEVGTDGGLIHDSHDLGVVYEVVRLPAGVSHRGREKRIDAKRDTIKKALRTLAGGKRSGLSAEEKRVLGLFPDGVGNDTLRAASQRVRFQLGQADKFRAGVRRMGRWELFIRQVLMERGLPVELVALPHVESSYNPNAYSHAGAAGLWQFTRSTGRRYMRVDHVVDERRDPFLSTVAAARLLKENYKITRAWPLAITAYNHGASGMRRAVRKLGTRDIDQIIDRYKGRSFGFASRNFYCEFLAALDVETNPERYFGPITKDPESDPEIVVLDHFYKASTLARTLGVSVDVLRAHNPALSSPVWKGQKFVPKAYGMRLPRAADRAAAKVVLASIPAAERYSKQIRDQRYRVRRGDTLGKIARRHGVSQSALMRANNIRNRNRIRVGQLLEIPGRVPNVSRTAQAAPAPQPVPKDGLYKVRRGDNLASIARRFSVSQSDLVALNRLRNRNHLAIGQVLQIPGGSRTAAATRGGQARPGVYKVRKGDTLEGIARRFGVTQKSIMELNELRSRHRIRVGQTLYVPGAEPAPPAEVARSKPPATPAPEAEAPQQAEAPPPTPSASATEPPATTTLAEAPAEPGTPQTGEDAASEPASSPAPAPTAQTETTATAPGPEPAAPASRTGPGELPLGSERYAVLADGRIEVQPEETLGHYAEWLETSARNLRKLNGLPAGRPLQLGNRLRLDHRHVSPQRFEERRRAHHREVQARFYGSFQISGTREYVLKRGDTLWKLSRSDDSLPVWLLRAYNPELDFGSLRAGQRVTIPRVIPRSG